MKQQWTSPARHRTIWVVTGALLLALGPYLLSQRAEGDAVVPDTAPHEIVVVGDSITARYNDQPGDPDQGWWSVVGRHYGASVRTYAQSGSGYLREGLGCTGNRFRDRPQAFDGPTPSIFIVEGGRNDWSQCVDGRFRTATDAQIAAAVDAYLGSLRRSLPPSTRIMVLGPPWGPTQPLEGLRVTAIVRESAVSHGLEFVDTRGTLDTDRVVDGVHPNRAGSLEIADRVIAAIG